MLGLRTTIYRVLDLHSAKNWYAKAFKTQPYFENTYYIGFDIGGFELGLQPELKSHDKSENIISYWGVQDIDESFQYLLECGARVHEKPNNVGGEIIVASVLDPWNNIIGIIYNPHFKAK